MSEQEIQHAMAALEQLEALGNYGAIARWIDEAYKALEHLPEGYNGTIGLMKGVGSKCEWECEFESGEDFSRAIADCRNGETPINMFVFGDASAADETLPEVTLIRSGLGLPTVEAKEAIASILDSVFAAMVQLPDGYAAYVALTKDRDGAIGEECEWKIEVSSSEEFTRTMDSLEAGVKELPFNMYVF